MGHSLYIIIIAASLVVCYFGWRFNHRTKTGCRDFIALIRTALNLNQKDESSLRGQIDGSPFYVETITHGGSPISVKIHFDCASLRRLTVHRENFVDRLAKSIGLAQELHTELPIFDRQFYIDSDDPTFAKKLFSDPNVRHHVRQLFSFGVILLDFSDELGTLTLTCNPRMARDLTSHDIRKLMASAAKLARLELPQTQKPGVIGKTWLENKTIYLLSLIGTLFFAILYPPPFLPLQWHEQHPLLIEPGLWTRVAWIGPPTFLPSALAGFLLLRGRSDAHKILFPSLGMILLLISVSNLFLFNFVNVTLDSSKVRRATYLVTNTDYFSPRRARTKYFLILKNVNSESRWPESVKLRVPPEIYDEAQTAKTALLRIKDGALGYPWVEKIRLFDR